MDITLNVQCDEATSRRTFRRAFYALEAPEYAQPALDIVLMVRLGQLLPGGYGLLAFGAALVLFCFASSWFFRTWKVYRELYRKSGIFDDPTVIRLTDSFIVTSCGGNESKCEYRVFSGFMRCRDFIVLTAQSAISGIYARKEFPDGGAEFAQCLEKAGVKEMPFFSFGRWWHLCLPVALLFAVESDIGGGTARGGEYHYPVTAAAQMRKHIDCRGTMLMIPVAAPDFHKNMLKVELGTPVEIRYPFDALPKLTGYQYVVHGYTWDIGKKGLLYCFLLAGEDGSLYVMRPPTAPFDSGDRDIRFYRTNLSPERKAAFSAASGVLELPVWSGKKPFRWRDPDAALPILRKFRSDHPTAADAGNGKWEHIERTCFTPNVYCERKLPLMPVFTAKEVLVLRPHKAPEKDGYAETDLLFPDGRTAGHIEGMKSELSAQWASGRYRVVAYDRRGEAELNDPERDHPWAPYLRGAAADMGIPLVILYGDDPAAPEYPGLPKGVRQFWQCPQCAAEQMRPVPQLPAGD